jgi:cytoskeletal protein CcmA (bactofilin family)
MSDPGPASESIVEGSPLNQSFTSGELVDSLPDTSLYFEAWLENLKPSLEPRKNQPADPAVAHAPAPGEISFEGTLRVAGHAAGFLRSLTGTLIIGESGEVEADIVVAIAIIDGLLRGNIHATERVVLGSHARVFGNIESPTLSIAPGAVFEGECHSTDLSGPNEEAAEPLAVAASR